MERQLDQWDLVIKVKYGDTLRRIGACVHGQLMDHNMSKLRAKIISLFKFRDDADLILTYTDEDGDIVTLDDDDELRDAVIGQRLNPLRIIVQLKSTDSTDARTETSLPANSPQSETLTAVGEQLKSVPEPLVGVLSNLVGIVQKTVPCSPEIGQKFDEVMKSEPFKSAMANLSKDVQKATSFSPALARVVEQVSNLGLSNVSQTSDPIVESSGGSIGGSVGASTHQVDLNVADEPKASKAPVLETTELQSNTAGSVVPVLKKNSSCDMVQGAGDAAPPSVDLNADATRDVTGSLYPFDDLMSSIWTANKYSEHEKEAGSSSLEGKSDAATDPVFPPANQTSQGSENFWNPVQLQPHPSYMDGSVDVMGGGYSTKQPPIMAHVSSPQAGFNSHSEVPIKWPIAPPPSDFRSILSQVMVPHPYRRSHVYNETTPPTFHKGVQCDGCGMHPIVGPRFKSNVKDDYDLCNICFSQMGNETDYTRIDRALHRAPGPFKEYHSPHSRHRANVLHGCAVRQHRGKLESRFIQDVTVLDGTAMPPSTHFTKIWRLRNNGTIPWPFGTQLVWVGGDKFGNRVSADLEIPANGFPVDKELDIAIDFTAPSRPGRYVSYWKMASPSGQKFGQRVWILIQVDYSRPSSAGSGSFYPDLNLNLPPESSARNGSGIIDVNAEPVDSGVAETNISGLADTTEELVRPVVEATNITGLAGTTEELVRPVVEDVPSGLVEHPAQVIADLLDASNAELSQSPLAAVVPSSVSYPLIDLQAMPSMVDVASVAAATADSNPVEQTLLKELEDMGFKQIDLNKEVLRLNEYDLEQSVDDLCGFAEWDPLLSELHEMGFYDNELNKKVLIKNGGSIKRAVLDLISGKMSE